MLTDKNKAGVLFDGREARADAEVRPVQSKDATPARDAAAEAGEKATKAGSSRVAFGGLFLFTMMLYIRPNDLVPGAFEIFQIVKLVAIFTILAYLGSQLSRGKGLTIWPLEMKMLAVIVLLALAFTPLAVSPQTSIETLSDSFFKV